MVLTWENMLDIGGLDEGFPVIGERYVAGGLKIGGPTKAAMWCDSAFLFLTCLTDKIVNNVY